MAFRAVSAAAVVLYLCVSECNEALSSTTSLLSLSPAHSLSVSTLAFFRNLGTTASRKKKRIIDDQTRSSVLDDIREIIKVCLDMLPVFSQRFLRHLFFQLVVLQVKTLLLNLVDVAHAVEDRRISWLY